MRTIRVEERDCHGDLTREFEDLVVEEREGYLVLYRSHGAMGRYPNLNEDTRWRRHNLFIHFPDRWYSVWLFWEPDWTFMGYYVNFQRPCAIEGECLRLWDLELDLTVSQRGTVRTKDAERFHQLLRDGTVTSMDFVNVLAGLVEVTAAISRREFPFDGSMSAWRPVADMGATTGEQA